jgi:hypothetical protein
VEYAAIDEPQIGMCSTIADASPARTSLSAGLMLRDVEDCLLCWRACLNISSLGSDFGNRVCRLRSSCGFSAAVVGKLGERLLFDTLSCNVLFTSLNVSLESLLCTVKSLENSDGDGQASICVPVTGLEI